jgi:hypothetical protein
VFRLVSRIVGHTADSKLRKVYGNRKPGAPQGAHGNRNRKQENRHETKEQKCKA